MVADAGGQGRAGKLERVALGVLFAFTAVSLIGYATFGLNPALLARVPQVAGFYAVSFHFFAQAQVWLAFGVLALVLWLRVGWKWVAGFVAVYLISLSSELLGTTVGLPFGEYRYTEALGPKWFGHVPVVIPLSWFSMALPAYALAWVAVPGAGLVARRVFLASLILLIWDLCLDPAMSYATAYWVWEQPGTYYGMPWLNLFGWYVTGLALMAALAWRGADRWLAGVPVGWLAAYYLANLLLPLGMSAAAGLWGAVVVTLLAGVVAGVAALGLRRRAGATAGVAPGVPA
jgi:uncharacterized membrane protein